MKAPISILMIFRKKILGKNVMPDQNKTVDSKN